MRPNTFPSFLLVWHVEGTLGHMENQNVILKIWAGLKLPWMLRLCYTSMCSQCVRVLVFWRITHLRVWTYHDHVILCRLSISVILRPDIMIFLKSCSFVLRLGFRLWLIWLLMAWSACSLAACAHRSPMQLSWLTRWQGYGSNCRLFLSVPRSILCLSS